MDMEQTDKKYWMGLRPGLPAFAACVLLALIAVWALRPVPAWGAQLTEGLPDNLVVGSAISPSHNHNAQGPAVADVTVLDFGGLQWYLVGDDTGGFVASPGSLTFLLKDSAGSTAFGSSTRYGGSALQQQMQTLYDRMDEREQMVLIPRTLTDTADAGPVADQALWAMNRSEAWNVGYWVRRDGFAEWWLREPGDSGGIMYTHGGMVLNEGAAVSEQYGARPAFSLDDTLVLFTSSHGGKPDTVGEALTRVAAPTGALRLTLPDSHLILSTEDAGARGVWPGDTVSVYYSQASAGENRTVSCVIADNSGQTLYYGKLAEASATGGEARFVVPADIADGTYALQLFTEECDGTAGSDYAGAFLNIPLTVNRTLPDANLWVNETDFGLLLTGYPPQPWMPLTISNSSMRPGVITDVTFSGPGGDAFELETGAATVTTMPNTSWRVRPADGVGGGIYTVPVSVFYDNGVGQPAVTQLRLAVNGPPGQPRNLTADPGSRQVALRWEAPVHDGSQNEYTITHYEVSADNGVSWHPADADDGHLFDGLASNTRYTFQVRAVSGQGDGVPAAVTATLGDSGGGTSPGNYTITFDSRGGTAVPGQSIQPGKTAVRPTAPQRDGYIFTGWYTDAACTRAYDFTAPVRGSRTLYAGWIPKGVERETVKPYITGYPDGTFRPGKGISRGETAGMLYRLAGTADGISGAAATSGGFTDVGEGDWYYDAVGYLSGLGVLDGYPDGSFQPDRIITRAEFTAVIVRFMGLEPGGASGFPDVADTNWAAGHIAAAQREGLVDGFPDGRFVPGGSMSRAQAVALVNRMLGRDTGEALFAGLELPFTDVPASHWAHWQIMAAAVEHKKPE